MAKEERKPRPVRLTEEAWDGLSRMADRNHVSRTALLEALGRLAATTKLPQAVIDLARQLDTERRSR